MKRGTRLLISAVCLALLALSWAIAAASKTNAQKQEELISEANRFIADEVYILAEPLLEEAASYEDAHTLEAEGLLKTVYLHLIDQSGYRRKYTTLLEKEMAREDAPPSVFEEAARYYFELSKTADALAVLRDGISKTGDEGLQDLYEARRYEFTTGRTAYDEVTSFFGNTIQVRQGDYWGIASASGTVIPCEYNGVSTYSDGRAIVIKDGILSAIDSNNNRLALYHGNAISFGNYSQDRLSIQTPDGWALATGSFTTGSVLFEDVGMFTDGYMPAKTNGKWGLVDTSGGKWLISPEYKDIIRDELGRAYAQNAVFVRGDDNLVRLIVDGKMLENTYEDAHPFEDGWAAVKQNGKWGFIDITGAVKIEYQFDDALSFGQHLAAVKVGDRWGYISLKGMVVIEPIYSAVKSFSDGSAAVRTDDGWKIITLTEYLQGGSGLL